MSVHVVLDGDAEEVVAMAFSPNGRLLATYGADGTLRRWSVDEGTATAPPLSFDSLTRPVCLAVGNDGTCWLGSPDGGLLQAGVPGDNRMVGQLGVTAVAVFPDNEHLVVGTIDGEVLEVAVSGPSPAGLARSRPIGPHPLTGPITVVAVSSDGTRFAAFGDDQDGYVVSVDAPSIGDPFYPSLRPVSLALPAPDGLVCVNRWGDLWRWGSTAWRDPGRIPDDDVTAGLAVHALSPDGTVVATGGRDGSVTVRTIDSAGTGSGARSGRILPRPRTAAMPVRVPAPLFDPRIAAGLITLMLATDDTSGVIDLDALVEMIACRRFPHRVPTRRHRSLAQGAQLLVDQAAGMTPFRADADHLADTVRAVLGHSAVEECAIVRTPFDLRSARYRLPPPGRPVLAITDLGIARPPGLPRARHHVRDWERLATSLRRRGSPLIALVPYPAHRWPRRLAESVVVVPWDRSTAARDVRRAIEGRPSSPPSWSPAASSPDHPAP